MLNPILSPNLLMTVKLCSCQAFKALFSCLKWLNRQKNAKIHSMPGGKKRTTAATKKQTKTSEILNRKTNSKAVVQVASVTQAERKTKLKTKLEGTSNVWGFGAFFWEVVVVFFVCLVLNVWHTIAYLHSILCCCPPKSIDLDQRRLKEKSC